MILYQFFTDLKRLTNKVILLYLRLKNLFKMLALVCYAVITILNSIKNVSLVKSDVFRETYSTPECLCRHMEKNLWFIVLIVFIRNVVHFRVIEVMAILVS